MTAQKFDIMPTNIHFFGTVSTSKNIIAYGNLGTYLISTNSGYTWQQKSINNFDEIRKIVNYRDTLWGISGERNVIKSTDHGLNWQEYEIPIPTEDTVANILLTNEAIYIRTFMAVYRFDRNLNLLSFNSDAIINVKGRNKTYIPNIISEYFYNGIFYINQKILVDCLYQDGIVTLSPDLVKLDTIRLREKIYMNNPSRYSIKNVMTFDSKPVINLTGNLYYPDEEFESWSYFYGDTSLYNRMDSKFYQKWGNLFYYSTFSYQNNLYVADYEWDINRNILTDGSVQTSIIDFGYKKYDVISNRLKDFNSLYYDKYYSSSYIDSYMRTSIGDMIRLNGSIYNDTVHIKTGFCKSILLSQDDFKSWKLISNLSGTPRAILNDSTYYFINESPYKNDIDRTSDYGITFLPTEIGLDTLSRVKIIRDSLGFPVDTTIVTDSVTYFAIFDKTLLFEINDDGRGFWAGSSINDFSKVNFAFTLDSGKRYKFKKFDNLDLGSSKIEKFASNIKRLNDKYLFCLNTKTPNVYSDTLTSTLYLIDSGFSSCLNYPNQAFFEVHYILAENEKAFIILTRSQDKNDLYNYNIEIKETKDSGLTFKTISSLKENLEIDQIYEHNSDSLFFTTVFPARLYLYDRLNNEIIKLYENNELFTIKIMFIDNVFFILGDRLFLKNNDRMDLSKWIDGQWPFGNPTFETIIFKGNIALVKFKDDIHPLDIYRITPNKTTGLNENDIEVKYYNNHFYASEPFPLPAKNIIKSSISWDMSFDLLDAIKGIYNIYGDKIEGRENIEINFLGKSSAEIIWQGNIATGIYFILIEHNGKSDIISFIIEN